MKYRTLNIQQVKQNHLRPAGFEIRDAEILLTHVASYDAAVKFIDSFLND